MEPAGALLKEYGRLNVGFQVSGWRQNTLWQAMYVRHHHFWKAFSGVKAHVANPVKPLAAFGSVRLRSVRFVCGAGGCVVF